VPESGVRSPRASEVRWSSYPSGSIAHTCVCGLAASLARQQPPTGEIRGDTGRYGEIGIPREAAAAGHAAAAGRHEQPRQRRDSAAAGAAGRAGLGVLLKQLQRQRALAENHVRVVKRVEQRAA